MPRADKAVPAGGTARLRRIDRPSRRYWTAGRGACSSRSFGREGGRRGQAGMARAAERKSVLAVDDDPSMRQMLGEILSPLYEVTLAGDGLEALEQIRRQAPDLVLLDLRMPRMAGWELLERLEREGQRVDVVVISATPEDCPESPLVRACLDKLASVPALLRLCQELLAP
jgi:CheY-like chemotaxis protein